MTAVPRGLSPEGGPLKGSIEGGPTRGFPPRWVTRGVSPWGCPQGESPFGSPKVGPKRGSTEGCVSRAVPRDMSPEGCAPSRVPRGGPRWGFREGDPRGGSPSGRSHAGTPLSRPLGVILSGPFYESNAGAHLQEISIFDSPPWGPIQFPPSRGFHPEDPQRESLEAFPPGGPLERVPCRGPLHLSPPEDTHHKVLFRAHPSEVNFQE
jgi:hypothetical protein